MSGGSPDPDSPPQTPGIDLPRCSTLPSRWTQSLEQRGCELAQRTTGTRAALTPQAGRNTGNEHGARLFALNQPLKAVQLLTKKNKNPLLVESPHATAPRWLPKGSAKTYGLQKGRHTSSSPKSHPKLTDTCPLLEW